MSEFHGSLRGFVFLMVFCTLCFGELMPHGAPTIKAWLLFIATMVFCTFLEVWAIRRPTLRPKMMSDCPFPNYVKVLILMYVAIVYGVIGWYIYGCM